MNNKDKLNYMIENQEKIHARYMDVMEALESSDGEIKSAYTHHEKALRFMLRNDFPFECFDNELFLLEYIVSVTTQGGEIK